jgi:hypothetical protein
VDTVTDLPTPALAGVTPAEQSRNTRRSSGFDTCQVNDCGKPHNARGMCVTHYDQWRKQREDAPICSIDGCGEPLHARAMCQMHYRHHQRALRAASQEGGDQ